MTEARANAVERFIAGACVRAEDVVLDGCEGAQRHAGATSHAISPRA